MSRRLAILMLPQLMLLGACAQQLVEGSNAGECSDGADNDADGSYDCADSDCAEAPDCGGDDDDTGDDDTGDDDTGDDDTGDDDTGDDDTGDDDDTGGPFAGVVYLGDLAFVSDAEMQWFCESYDTVAGDVRISGIGVTTLAALDCLVRVDGLLEISSSDILDLEFPALEEVGGDLHIFDNYPLGGVELLALRGVGGSVQIDGHPWLDELRMPALESVTGDLFLRESASLAQLSLPALEDVSGSLWLRYLDALVDLELNSLTTVGSDLWVSGNLALAELAMPALLFVGANPALQQVTLAVITDAGGLRITSNPILDDLQMPQLRDMVSLPGWLRVSSCAGLAVLSLPALERVGDFLMLAGNAQLSQLQLEELEFVGGDFYITDNPSLPAAAAEALRSAVGDGNIGGDVVISGNGSR